MHWIRSYITYYNMWHRIMTFTTWPYSWSWRGTCVVEPMKSFKNCYHTPCSKSDTMIFPLLFSVTQNGLPYSDSAVLWYCIVCVSCPVWSYRVSLPVFDIALYITNNRSPEKGDQQRQWYRQLSLEVSATQEVFKLFVIFLMLLKTIKINHFTHVIYYMQSITNICITIKVPYLM